MASSVRVLVCGGRDFRDYDTLSRVLDGVWRKHEYLTIISGAASGADNLAAAWAKDRGVDLREFPADWKAHGKAAGRLRNQQMIDEGRPNAVVAFPGGRGTRDMKRRAVKAGLKVWEPCTKSSS